MPDKEPWKVEGVPWKTEAAFWSWVRGVLRKGWSKHPVKLEYIKQHRKRIKNPKPSTRFPTVWGMTCSCCKKDTVQAEIEIDHISETGGTFRGLDDFRDYAAYLFLIDFDSIRAVCKPCHEVITLAQKLGISFEEAQIEKQIIAFMKQKKEKILAFCKENGYNVNTLTNADKRRGAVEEIFRRLNAK